MKEKYRVEGMTCSSCVAHVEKAVSKLEGVDTVNVSLLTNSMQVTYDEQKTSEAQIIQAVEKAGYGAVLNNEELHENRNVKQASTKAGMPTKKRLADREEEQNKAMKTRLIVSFAFLIPLMYVAMYHMFQDWFGLPIPKVMHQYFHGPQNAITFGLTQFILLLPILYVNRKYFQVGFKSLAHGMPNMDTLIAIGSMAATVYGVFALFRIGYGLGYGQIEVVEKYSMDLYFESAGTILTLITLGKYMETKSKGKTSEAIRKLMDLSPKTAWLEKNGSVIEVPLEEIQVDDIVQVKPGSSIPVDGIIVEGQTSIDEAAITGESIPVEREMGDSVIAATINKEGFIRVQATKVGNDTTLSQIIRLVEEAASSKAPIAKLADKIAGVFVPVVIGIAIIACILWLVFGATVEFALSIGIGVLVISCPCALGLATPVAIMVGTGRGASKGILIKSGEALQSAQGIQTIVIDKTGTLTKGEPKVTDVIEIGSKKENFLQVIASLENPSEHPLSKAIVKEALEQKTEILQVQNFEAVFGKGVQGEIQGEKWLGGNEAFLKENGIFLLSEQQNKMEQLSADGKTPLLFATKDGLQGIVAVADEIKETSKEAIERFHKLGIQTVMLTGDNEITARAIGKKLGMDEVKANVLPQQKEEQVRQLQAQGKRVAMIGDGINDAPALASADVGIAIGAGTDIAIESADIVLMKSDLLDAVTAIQLSKAVLRNIKENLFWAFFYNCIGIPLAAGVFYPAFGIKLNPMFGAAAMSLSSIFVVGNALRLRFFGTEKEKSGSKETVNKKTEDRKEMKIIMEIEGMACGHCTGRVEAALREVAGVEDVIMSLENKTAEVTATQETSEEALKKAVEEAGYTVVRIS